LQVPAIPTGHDPQCSAKLADCKRNCGIQSSHNQLTCRELCVSIAQGMELAKKSTGSLLAKSYGGHCAMKVKPLGDRIVVRRQEAEEKTAGGLYLPDTAKNKPQRGKVLAVGPGRLLKDGRRQKLQVKEGDTILFTNWAGEEYKSREDQILLMREEDV